MNKMLQLLLMVAMVLSLTAGRALAEQEAGEAVQEDTSMEEQDLYGEAYDDSEHDGSYEADDSYWEDAAYDEGEDGYDDWYSEGEDSEYSEYAGEESSEEDMPAEGQ